MLSVICAAGLTGQPARPNIVFIFSDDHASHAISAYGSRINQTPHIDQLANEGAIFENCFVTNSICGPSRAVILTGKHSHLNGVKTNASKYDNTQITFPMLLQQAGYKTSIIGKWHLSSDPTGFHDWKVLIGQGEYYNPRLKTAEGIERVTGYTTDILTNLAKDWLKEQAKSPQPFLLMLQHKAPHRNWQPGPRYLTKWENETIPEPADLLTRWDGLNSGAKTQEMSIAEHLRPAYDLKLGEDRFGLTDSQFEAFFSAYAGRRSQAQQTLTGDAHTRRNYQWYIKDYLRCVQSVDDSVGEIRSELDRLGLGKNTVLIYCSDQGFFLGDKGWYDKRWMYEPSLKTPLVVRWPAKIKPKTQVTAMAQNLDFAQTFLDLAGVKAPKDMQGFSLVPLLTGEIPADWRKSIYYRYTEGGEHAVPKHRGVRTDRYKLIEYDESGEWELFDLHADPLERNNLAERPDFASLRSRLTRLLRAHQSQVGDK
ncbi:sulfatase [Kamptonema cortianum]|nr:sulfatase [Geitlerinema splendidum]MDK3160390.1 sulfatase [Kamptonema cortianum]